MASRWISAIALAGVAAAAGAVLFWRLGDRYLWQDEAAIALLGERIFEHGKPLAYDGRNLLTMDVYLREELGRGEVPTAEPEAAVRYWARRGDYREDTTWIRHPWGSLVLAGLSLEAFGHGTLQARLPFALSAIGAVVLLWWLVHRRFGDTGMATLAALLCLGNAYWLLHMRQCHYNAPSGLMLLVTLAAYLRWQDRRPFGAAAFVAASWLWFHFDYGSIWPALAVLYADAIRASWPNALRVLFAGSSFAAVTAPFVAYYDLLGRPAFGNTGIGTELFFGYAFYLNQFMIPFVLLPVLGWLMWGIRSGSPPGRLRLLGIAMAIPAATLLWLTSVSPLLFYRYLVHLTPLLALLVAWTAMQAGKLVAARMSVPAWLPAAALVVLLLVSPLPAGIVSGLLPEYSRGKVETGVWIRSEVTRYAQEMTGKLADPGAAVIRAVADRLEDGDEILVNYEDRPFMFYTKARVRGGIGAFRVGDPAPPPPRFFVFRRSARFTNEELFFAEVRKHHWVPVPVRAADVPWSNIPDPRLRRYLYGEGHPDVVVLERVGKPRKGAGIK